MKVFIALCLLASVLAEAPESGTNVYFVVSPKPDANELAKVTQEVMSRIKSQEGSDSGQYNVYLPDGRLQKVQYATAPVKPQTKTQAPAYYAPKPQPQEYKQESKPSKFVASVQYTDVAPLDGPVYAYNPQPLVRIVRYAPYF